MTTVTVDSYKPDANGNTVYKGTALTRFCQIYNWTAISYHTTGILQVVVRDAWNEEVSNVPVELSVTRKIMFL